MATMTTPGNHSYSLEDVLAIASVHPFYSDATYPPTRGELPTALEKAKQSTSGLTLSSFPLTRKNTLYKQIARLTIDTSPRNGYRQDTYISTTGGGSGGVPMVFATDSIETREQRAMIGLMMKTCGIIESGDWVLTMHNAGHFYRSLDLMAETFESAGAAVLCAGPDMHHSDIVDAIAQFLVNAISGDVGHLIQLAKYVATLSEEKRKSLHVTKAIYTSEAITPAQRSYLFSVFGDIALSSVIGSAEAGPWAVSCPEQTTATVYENHADFIFDDRLIHLEVLPFSIEDESDENNSRGDIAPVPDGEKGLLVQTSLQRLRNPLLRYVCGDVASLHPLPDTVRAKLPSESLSHYHVVRIYGRDRRISFDWYGEYFEFQNLQALMRIESWGILQYQVIRRHKDNDRDNVDTVLEVRILRNADSGNISQEELAREIKHFFMVLENNEHLFELKFLADHGGFVRSTTGRKVINFLDLCK